MGQKVHPKGLRLEIVKDWDIKWFSKKKYSQLVYEDYKIRQYTVSYTHLDVYKRQGEKIGEIKLREDLFNAKINKHVVHQIVKRYLSEKRDVYKRQGLLFLYSMRNMKQKIDIMPILIAPVTLTMLKI